MEHRRVTSEPLVLLPGMNCSSTLWSQTTEELSRILHVADIRCAELTGSSIDGCVTALLDQLPPRFALAGLSLGGIVSMALIRRAPEQVSRLCLMSTNPRPPTSEQLQAWQESRRALSAGLTARELQRSLLPVLVADSERTADIEAKVLSMADDIGTKRLDAQLSAQATRIDERSGLPSIAVPTLVIAAAQDAMCAVSRHEEIHALIPGSQLTVLEGQGHLSPLEAPALVAGHLAEWLKRRR